MTMTAQFFASLCKASDGDESEIVDALEIGAALRMSGADVLNVVDDLTERGLVEDATIDDNRPMGEIFVRLTAWGCEECEKRRQRNASMP